MPNWQYISSGNVSKNITVTSTTAYENAKTTEEITLTAKNMPKAELDVELARARGAIGLTPVYRTGNGTEIQGILKSVSYTEQEGTGLYEATIVLERQLPNPAISWAFVGAQSVDKSIVYNATEYYEEQPLVETVTLSAKNVPKTDAHLQIEYSKMPPGISNYVTADQSSYSGVISACNISENMETGLYDVTVTLKMQPPATSITWKYVGSGGADRPIIIAKSMRTSSGSYPANRYYYYEAAEETATISAKGVPYGTVQSEISRVKSAPAIYSYTVAGAGTINGIPKGVQWRQDEKTSLYEVTVTLQITT
jgi:hypothetical protein